MCEVQYNMDSAVLGIFCVSVLRARTAERVQAGHLCVRMILDVWAVDISLLIMVS